MNINTQGIEINNLNKLKNKDNTIINTKIENAIKGFTKYKVDIFNDLEEEKK